MKQPDGWSYLLRVIAPFRNHIVNWRRMFLPSRAIKYDDFRGGSANRARIDLYTYDKGYIDDDRCQHCFLEGSVVVAPLGKLACVVPLDEPGEQEQDRLLRARSAIAVEVLCEHVVWLTVDP